MKILIFGQGGREHALAWKLKRESGVSKVCVAPGNPGMLLTDGITCVEVENNISAWVECCQRENPELVVIGPEAHLAMGLSDILREKGFLVFGPSSIAAKLESSKIFAKEIMTETGIPTAKHQVYSGHEAAVLGLRKWDVEKGIALKVDGLASGKGVVVTKSREEAKDVLHRFMVDESVSIKTEEIIIEEQLHGKEISAFALCDGTDAHLLGLACDYKRWGEGNTGPNTGGMGGYAPPDFGDQNLNETIKQRVIFPVLNEMRLRGHPFRGCLFVGLMATEKGPYVLEFNARFGDPETQILMPLLEGDLHLALMACAEGDKGLRDLNLKLNPLSSVHVVLTSEGYPGLEQPMKLGVPLRLNFKKSPDAFYFFAGVKEKNGNLVNSGGRVAGVTATGDGRFLARERAYRALDGISFSGAYRRGDIGS